MTTHLQKAAAVLDSMPTDASAALLAKLDAGQREAVEAEMTVAPRERPFASLHQVEPRRLHAWLAGEHPQTIALVLWHLPRQLAMSVLRSFPDAMQQSLVRRIAEMRVTDPAVVHDVEQALAERMVVPPPHLRRF